jgi:hypothetical protein
MIGMAERYEYLRRLEKAAERTDWTVVHFAFMGTHSHLLGRAGCMTLDELMKGLNTGIAGWLNRRDARTGPVFAGRPSSIICTSRTGAVITSYISNNPPRAGVVTLARESRWTAHQLYLDPRRAPTWLNVELGLELAGFSSTENGRLQFDEYVNERRAEPRNDALSGRLLPRIRREARAQIGAPVEVATPIVDVDEMGVTTVAPLVSRHDARVTLVRRVPAEVVAQAASGALGIAHEVLRHAMPSPERSAGRRLSLIVWTRVLGQRASEMASVLAISGQAASKLIQNREACQALQPLVPAVMTRLEAA